VIDRRYHLHLPDRTESLPQTCAAPLCYYCTSRYEDTPHRFATAAKWAWLKSDIEWMLDDVVNFTVASIPDATVTGASNACVV